MAVEPNDPIEAHVSDMLAEAMRLHQSAMEQLHSPHDNPLPRLRKALTLLEGASILAEDSASFTDSPVMRSAIKQLYQQQGQIQAMMAQLEAGRSRPSFQTGLLVGVLALVILGLFLSL